MKLKDLNLYDIGNKIGLVGAVFGDDKRAYLLLFPDQSYPGPAEPLELTYDDWKTVIRQTDLQEVEVLQRTANGDLAKTILRKAQRLHDQRVSWNVFRRDGYRCRYCGRDDVPLTVDHLICWESMGPTIEDNLVSSCRKCNKNRGETPYDQWLNHPYYLQVSQYLDPVLREKNRDLVDALPHIPLRVAERESRK